MNAATILSTILQDSNSKTSNSFTVSFDMTTEKRSTEIQQVLQSSSAPTSSEYSSGYIGLVNDPFPFVHRIEIKEIAHDRHQVRAPVRWQRKVQPGTDSFVKDRSSPPKSSPDDERSKIAHDNKVQQREAAAASSLSKSVTFCYSKNNTNELFTADQVFSSSAGEEEKLIRPQPIKNAPSGAQVALVAPVATFLSSEQTSRLSIAALKSTILQTNVSRTNSTGERRIETASADKRKDLGETVSEKARKERELRRARETKEIGRLQKLQCDFPETQESTMSGRDFNDHTTPHAADGTNGDCNHEPPLPHDNMPQVSNRISLRSPDPRRSGGDEHDQPMNPPTPLFERLVTEEVHEIKAYARILESQNRRLAQLERVHGDLEARLQVESQGRQELEATLEAREREWAKQLEQLESDRNHWRHLVQVEETKNNRLMEEVMRKEQEIRRMLQRKYDHDGRSTRTMPGRSATPTEKVEARSPEMGRSDLRSPHDVLKASGSAEKVRLRNMEGLLQDFFGM